MDGEAIISATVAQPWMYVALLFGGIVAFGLRALVKGDLRTGREVEHSHERIENLEEAVRTRDAQVNRALEVLPEIEAMLSDLHPSSKAVES